MVSCWLQFSDGAVTPLVLFDRSAYSLTISTPDEGVATVRRTPQSTFIVAQGESDGRGALVRAELRICEECQKSKRKSKLAVGTALLKINTQGGSSGGAGGGASEVVGEIKTTVASQRAVTTADKPRSSEVGSTGRSLEPHAVWIRSTTRSFSASTPAAPSFSTRASSTASSTAMSLPSLRPPPGTTWPASGGAQQDKNYRNMLDRPLSPLEKDSPKLEVTTKKEPPTTKPPKVIESDLIRKFRAMSDLEIGMYALVGVSCVAILAFLLNCASYSLCFRNNKTPIQVAPPPSGDPKDHKHDWVWLGSNGHSAAAPAQVSTLKREAHRPLEPCSSMESVGALPTVSLPAAPERTATLGRSRASSQQQQFQGKAPDPLANRSATLLARPHRGEPLHSPTSKRNQVQFTTFTTLDIKHLAALKRNGGEMNWTNQQQTGAPSEPQTPLPDMPWPVVKPLGDPQ